MCKPGSIIKSHELHFPQYMVNTMIVYEVALGLFALQLHAWLVAQN